MGGGEITAAPSRGLPFLRDLSVYIQASGLCSGCHVFGCDGGWVEGLVVCRAEY